MKVHLTIYFQEETNDYSENRIYHRAALKSLQTETTVEFPK